MAIAAQYPTIRPSLDLNFAATKELDPRITFARASTATYYDGKTTAVAEQNLLTYSEQFDNAAWTKSNATVTANSTTAPDGTTTAETIVEDTATSAHCVYRTISVAAADHVFSVYCKAATRSWVYIRFAVTSGQGAYFDLTNGVVGTVESGITASISNAGNGWYRCSVKITTTASTWYPQVGPASGDNAGSYTGDGTSGIYIWGAQLEQRSAVSSYTPTTSQPITNYIPALQTAAAGVPRFDHDPVTGESKGFLIEEQRTNLLTYSSDFSNAVWTKSNVALTTSANVSPDGTLTATLVADDTTNGEHRIYQSQATTSTTRSIYAKAGTAGYISISRGSAASGYAIFDLLTGVVSASSNITSAAITAVGNGWYRCQIVGGVSEDYIVINIGTTAANAVPQVGYAGTGKYVFLWGAQKEAGSFATSYIPTVASQVTRSADSASMTGSNFSSWYRADEGTLYADVSSLPPVDSFGFVVGCNTYAYFESNSIWISNNGISGVGNYVSAFTYASGATRALMDLAPARPAFKTAYAYKTNDFLLSLNGTLGTQDTSGVVPTPTALRIGGRDDGYILNGTIKRIAYYPARLSDTNLQAITS